MKEYVNNVLLKDLECPKCKTFGTVINTGQELRGC